MDEDEFLTGVQRRADIDSREAALAASEATLVTLGERITVGEAQDLAAHLPDRFADAITRESDENPETYTNNEFVDRVRERESERSAVDKEEARAHAEAVLTSLGERIDEDAWENATAQLPEDYDQLLNR